MVILSLLALFLKAMVLLKDFRVELVTTKFGGSPQQKERAQNQNCFTLDLDTFGYSGVRFLIRTLKLKLISFFDET